MRGNDPDEVVDTVARNSVATPSRGLDVLDAGRYSPIRGVATTRECDIATRKVKQMHVVNRARVARLLAVLVAVCLSLVLTAEARAYESTKYWLLDPNEGQYLSETWSMGNGCQGKNYSSSNTDSAFTDLYNPSSTCVGVRTRVHYTVGTQARTYSTSWSTSFASTPAKPELRYSYHWYKYAW